MGKYREDIGKIIRLLVMTPTKYVISSVIVYINVKSYLMIFDKFSHLKYRYGNWRFWSMGYHVSTVGLNGATTRKYIREQDREDIMLDNNDVQGIYGSVQSKAGEAPSGAEYESKYMGLNS